MASGSKPKEAVVRDIGGIGDIIRAWRVDRDQTLDAAASELGVGRRLLAELEGGKRNVTVAKLLSILDQLGLEMVVRSRRRGPPRWPKGRV